jgi:hypothetical protein
MAAADSAVATGEAGTGNGEPVGLILPHACQASNGGLNRTWSEGGSVLSP